VTVRGRDNNGRLAETRTLRVDAIDSRPADTYSENFVGTTPMTSPKASPYVPHVYIIDHDRWTNPYGGYAAIVVEGVGVIYIRTNPLQIWRSFTPREKKTVRTMG